MFHPPLFFHLELLTWCESAPLRNLRSHYIFSCELHNYLQTSETHSYLQLGDLAAYTLSFCNHKSHPSCGTTTFTRIYSYRRNSKQCTFTLEENIAVVIGMKQNWQKQTLKRGTFFLGETFHVAGTMSSKGATSCFLKEGGNVYGSQGEQSKKKTKTHPKTTNRSKVQKNSNQNTYKQRKRGVFSLLRRHGKCFQCYCGYSR